MTDYSWLEPIERRTKEIREETQRMREEIEKMKQESHNLPVPDNAPWLNLSQEEINQLRNQKHSLTEYGKQKFKEMTTGQLMDTEKFQEEFAKLQCSVILLKMRLNLPRLMVWNTDNGDGQKNHWI